MLIKLAIYIVIIVIFVCFVSNKVFKKDLVGKVLEMTNRPETLNNSVKKYKPFFSEIIQTHIEDLSYIYNVKKDNTLFTKRMTDLISVISPSNKGVDWFVAHDEEITCNPQDNVSRFAFSLKPFEEKDLVTMNDASGLETMFMMYPRKADILLITGCGYHSMSNYPLLILSIPKIDIPKLNPLKLYDIYSSR